MIRYLAAGWIAMLLGCSRGEDPPRRVEPLSPTRASGVDLASLPFQLDGQSTFLEHPPGLIPRYFCECSDTPVELPPEASNQRVFQLVRGIMGVSMDPEGRYVVKKLATFQTIFDDDRRDRKLTERIIEFPEKPAQDTATTLELASDLPSRGSTLTRRTVFRLDKQSQTGGIHILLWRSSDRTAKPMFDHVYPVRCMEVPRP